MPEFTLSNGTEKISLLFDYNREVLQFGDKWQRLDDLIPYPGGVSARSWQHNPVDRGQTGLPEHNWPEPPSLEVNRFYWPCTGISRYARGVFLVGQESRDKIGTWDSGEPLTLRVDTVKKVDPVSKYVLESSLIVVKCFALAPRRISSPKVEKALYLLPVVDPRYFLQWRDTGDIMGALEVPDSEGSCQNTCAATWSTLFDHLAEQLGIELEQETVPEEYLQPDCGAFARQYHSAVMCMDAAAASVGMRIVAKHDGTYHLQDAAAARSKLDENVELLAKRQVAGYDPEELDTRHLPETIRVCFPKVRCRSYESPADYYTIDVETACPTTTTGTTDTTTSTTTTTTTTGEPEATTTPCVDEFIPIPGSVKTYHSTAKADFGTGEAEPVEPSNQEELQALAERIAEDYKAWRHVEYDFTTGTTEAWKPCGYDDHVIYNFGREDFDELFALTDCMQVYNSPEWYANTHVGWKYRRDYSMRIQSFRLEVDVDAMFHGGDVEVLPEQPDPDRCILQNGSCEDWQKWDALQIDSPLNTGSNCAAPCHCPDGTPIFRAITPVSDNARIAILQEDVDQCTTGRAVISGLTRTRVDILNESHKWAKAVAGSRVLVSTSNSSAPAEIIWHEAGTGERCADVLLSTRSTAPTTAEPDVEPIGSIGEVNPCGGRCKFIWTVSSGQWNLDEEYGGCGTRTTTSTSTTTGTTGEPTTTTTPCCDFAERESDVTTTTTTIDPEEDCNCLYPTFCGSADGQCAYTDCSTLVNSPPVCESGTTAEPTTSTTCDCEAAEVPTECAGGCSWVGVPSLFGGWKWQKVSDTCSMACPCTEPGGDPECAGPTFTGCEITGVDPPDPVEQPECNGGCVFYWLPDAGIYYQVSNDCSGNPDASPPMIPGCRCAPPSEPGDECAPHRTPCVAPAQTTTTGDGGSDDQFDPCVYQCFGIATSTTTSTTPEPDCDSARCIWESNATATGWINLINECPTQLGCYCMYPPRDPIEDCEVYRAPCYYIDFTTTTSSTSSTSTSTSSTTSTTTTQPPCDPDQAALRCVQFGPGMFFWQLVVACPNGFDYDPASCGTCADGGVGNWCCVDCTTTTTTTQEPTTTSTTTTTTTCELCEEVTVAALILGGNRYAYQLQVGQWVLCDSNCDPGYVVPDQDSPQPACDPEEESAECDYCNGLCSSTTTSTPEPTTTTSTTTAAPTTTTTTTEEPTTTTTQELVSDSCQWRCDGATETWEFLNNNCAIGNSCVTPGEVCDMLNDGEVVWYYCSG